jgi:hypothetical protein
VIVPLASLLSGGSDQPAELASRSGFRRHSQRTNRDCLGPGPER